MYVSFQTYWPFVKDCEKYSGIFFFVNAKGDLKIVKFAKNLWTLLDLWQNQPVYESPSTAGIVEPTRPANTSQEERNNCSYYNVWSSVFLK